MLRGRRVSSKKLNSLLYLCLSETALIARLHQERLYQAQADVAALLRAGQACRALLWVERVIREQTMIDVMFMLQQIIRILNEEALHIIQTQKFCPYEVREAMVSLIYAVPRCGDCAKLRKLSKLLESWFMKHSYTCSSEANPQMVEMLSTAELSLESRMEMMEEIAKTNEIAFDLKRSSLSEFDF